MENDDEIIREFLQNNQRVFDVTYSNKYIKRINIFFKLLLINSIICLVLLISYKIRMHKNIDVNIFYTFFSMAIFHVIGMAHSFMYLNDLEKTKNGEAIYLRNYYPDIWGKINPSGALIWRSELLKYQYGKYIPKNTDPVIDKIKKDYKKMTIYFLPFILVIVFIVIELIIS
jgi:hypothetical protein